MSEEISPKVINLFDRTEYVAPAPADPLLVADADKTSIRALESALEDAKKGLLHGVCIVGVTYDEDGCASPEYYFNFPERRKPSEELYYYTSLLDAMKDTIKDMRMDAEMNEFEEEMECD